MKSISVRSIPVVLAVFLFLAFATSAMAAEPQHLSKAVFSFGLATQTDGEVLVIAAPDESVAGSSAQGAVYVYELREGAWQEVARLTASDGDALDRFGAALAVDANVILVAAPDASVNTLPEAGAVYVFERNAAGAWTETAKIVAEDASTMAKFGASLAMDGERMIVAAPGAPGELESEVGAAYLFEYNAGAQSWQQTARIARGINFATDVDVSGDRIAIALGNEQGFVYTYRYDGSDWVFEIPVQPAAGNDNKVALEGDVLVVGTPSDVLPERPWSDVGAVHVFERGTSTWEHVAEFYQEFPGPLGMFGDYLDMNDGLIAAAGSGENNGAVSLIRKNETGEWVQTFTPVGASAYGGSVAVSARALAAGGVSRDGGAGSSISVLDVTELLAGDAPDDEPPAEDDPPADDPPTEDDPPGNPPDNDDGDTGNDDMDDDDDTAGGTGDEDNGDDSSDGGNADDNTGSGGANDAAGDTSGDAGSDSGGGFAGGLFLVLLPLLVMTRRR